MVAQPALCLGEISTSTPPQPGRTLPSDSPLPTCACVLCAFVCSLFRWLDRRQQSASPLSAHSIRLLVASDHFGPAKNVEEGVTRADLAVWVRRIPHRRAEAAVASCPFLAQS